MQKTILMLAGVVMVGMLSVLVLSPVRGADIEVDISGGEFGMTSVTLYVNSEDRQSIRFENLDEATYSFKIKDSQGSTVKSKTLQPVTSGSNTTYSPQFDIDDVGEYTYGYDEDVVQGGVLSVVEGEIPVTTASPTPTASATPTMTSSPTATVTPSATPTVSPTMTSTPSSTPSATPSSTPSATASATPTPMPTSTSTPTPTVSPTMTATPSPSPSVTPSVSPTATPSVSPSVSPSASSSPTATPEPTATPTPTVEPTPSGEVLPAFEIFRSTSCSAAVVDEMVVTRRLSSARMTEGYWDIISLDDSAGVAVEVGLDRVRSVNLFFRGNPFFGGDKTYVANGEKILRLEENSLDEVLEVAGQSWCDSWEGRTGRVF
jgi:hypothetical protein